MSERFLSCSDILSENLILGTGIGKSGTETCIEQSFWKAKSSEI